MWNAGQLSAWSRISSGREYVNSKASGGDGQVWLFPFLRQENRYARTGRMGGLLALLEYCWLVRSYGLG